MKKRALRKNVWYSTLDRVERGIVSLTARIVDRVNSKLLGIELVKIMLKLVKAMKSEFVKNMSDFGFNRARELSQQALKWGCKVAIGWVSELNFVTYLVMMSLNEPIEFSCKIR